MESANPTPTMHLSAGSTKSIKINDAYVLKDTTSLGMSATFVLLSKHTTSTLDHANVLLAMKELTETAPSSSSLLQSLSNLHLHNVESTNIWLEVSAPVSQISTWSKEDVPTAFLPTSMMLVWLYVDQLAKTTNNWTSTLLNAFVCQDISILKENAELVLHIPFIIAEKKFVIVSRTTFSMEEDVFQKLSDHFYLQNSQLIQEIVKISMLLELEESVSADLHIT